MSIGERIKLLRKALNLTQVQFAARLRISKGFVSNLEKDRVSPSEQLLLLMSYEFSSSEYWLINGEGEMFLSPETIIKQGIDRLGEQVFLEAFKKTMDEKGLVVPIGSLAYRLGNNQDYDQDLIHMVNFLTDLWLVGDEDLKAWAKVQFSRAFPPDVEEEVQKKRAEKQERTSTG